MRVVIIATALTCVTTSIGVGQVARQEAFFGGGFEAIGVGAAYERAYGLSFQAGHVWQFRRLGLRLGATYYERTREPNPGSSIKARAVGVSAELSYDLTVTRFRPYLIAGGGVYRLSASEVRTSVTRVVDQVSPAMIGGFGFRYRLNGMAIFTEARVHGLTNGRNWGGAFMPVTFGVRWN
jgi:hypothetical protein